ncbi:MAG: hypothetical protein A3E80_01975 [Chlamydiae bacterium RIFCSPHIGHO2_12_FULL_49_9]|nr:MAG: hypothetical protein A3E80_01975 [Chlamydiae bacterium RIFCSPHIGHO2_12_FULL_49_9]
MRSLHPFPIFPSGLEPQAARSLSLQFILQELLSSFALSEKLSKFLNEPPVETSLTHQINLISRELEKVLLFSLENPFSQKGGSLDKLCFYCEILLQASNAGGQEVPLILEEMRISVLKFKSILMTWKRMPALHPIDSLTTLLFEFYSEIAPKLTRFFKALFPYLFEARRDENVVLCLLEKRDLFNFYLGAKTIEKLLSRLFPEGTPQLRKILSENYAARGFSSFFTECEPLIDALELAGCPRGIQS